MLNARFWKVKTGGLIAAKPGDKNSEPRDAGSCQRWPTWSANKTEEIEMTKQIKTFRVIEGFSVDVTLPAGCKEYWEVYNAPRPFPATVTWQGEFISGVFYGAINPEDEFADENRERARQLDVTRLIFVPRAEVEAWGRAYCEKYNVEYEDFTWRDIAVAYLNHAEQE